MPNTQKNLPPHLKTRSLGKYGEDLALTFLERRGHRILARNFSWRYGEIDFITQKNSGFHFIEVKYRSTVDFGLPQESVVQRKQQRIRKTAVQWIQRQHFPIDSEMHFDVLAISKDIHARMKYEFIEDAF